MHVCDSKSHGMHALGLSDGGAWLYVHDAWLHVPDETGGQHECMENIGWYGQMCTQGDDFLACMCQLLLQLMQFTSSDHVLHCALQGGIAADVWLHAANPCPGVAHRWHGMGSSRRLRMAITIHSTCHPAPPTW